MDCTRPRLGADGILQWNEVNWMLGRIVGLVESEALDQLLGARVLFCPSAGAREFDSLLSASFSDSCRWVCGFHLLGSAGAWA